MLKTDLFGRALEMDVNPAVFLDAMGAANASGTAARWVGGGGGAG